MGGIHDTPPGVPIEVPLFDAIILQANGWTIVAGALQPLTLSAAAFHVGAPQGTVVGTILGASSGSAITFKTRIPRMISNFAARVLRFRHNYQHIAFY
jgi:hypothetical protein